MGYQSRRYRVAHGKLEKRWDGTDDPEWFKTKIEAWAAVAEAPPPKAVEVPPPVRDYENWKAPQLRAEIKARTGKGPRVGTESSKVAMAERLRGLDAEAGYTA